MGYGSSGGISISASTISNTKVLGAYYAVQIAITGSTLTNNSIVAENYASNGINIFNSTITGGHLMIGCCGAKLHIEGLAVGVTPAVRSRVNNTDVSTSGGGTPVNGPLELVNTDLTDAEINLPYATGIFAGSSFTYDSAYGTRNQITIGNGTLSHSRIRGNGLNTGLIVSGYAGYQATGNASITYNDITQNRVGVTATSGSTGAFSMSNCNLTNNSLYNLQYQRSANVTLPNNWWGTTSTTTISSLIYDGNQNILYGIVTFTPFLTAPQSGTGP